MGGGTKDGGAVPLAEGVSGSIGVLWGRIGTISTWPQPGHLPLFPEELSSALIGRPQCSHSNRNMNIPPLCRTAFVCPVCASHAAAMSPKFISNQLCVFYHCLTVRLLPCDEATWNRKTCLGVSPVWPMSDRVTVQLDRLISIVRHFAVLLSRFWSVRLGVFVNLCTPGTSPLVL